MPSIEKHVEISRLRTGKDYFELHEWMDADLGKKAERHDVTRICEYGQLMKAKYGDEGLEEIRTAHLRRRNHKICVR